MTSATTRVRRCGLSVVAALTLVAMAVPTVHASNVAGGSDATADKEGGYDPVKPPKDDSSDKAPHVGFGDWFADGVWSAPVRDAATFRADRARRAVDTRADQRPFSPGEQRRFAVADSPDVVAVAVTITAVSPTTDTFLTVWNPDRAMPETSTVNVSDGGVRANAAIVEVSDSGEIAVFNSTGDVDVLIDVTGTFTGTFRAVPPWRAVDTRQTEQVSPETSISVDVVGADVGPSAAAVVVNVTAVNAFEPTFLTVWGTGERPDTSNLNVSDGAAVANMAVVAIDDRGEIEVFNSSGDVDVLIDVLGYLEPGTGYRRFGPHRKLDTRQPSCPLAFGPGETRRVNLHVGASEAVALNVTAVDASEPTYLTVWPAGAPQPDMSTVNVSDGSATPNFTMVGTGWANQVDIYNSSGNVHVLVDVFGVVDGEHHPGTVAWCPQPPKHVDTTGKDEGPKKDHDGKDHDQKK